MSISDCQKPNQVYIRLIREASSSHTDLTKRMSAEQTFGPGSYPTLVRVDGTENEPKTDFRFCGKFKLLIDVQNFMSGKITFKLFRKGKLIDSKTFDRTSKKYLQNENDEEDCKYLIRAVLQDVGQPVNVKVEDPIPA